ncbi:hypothetical protein GCM10009716_19000 [Streptomyces sodiiphilus]|uniref:GNAT family N-acetyltransferase n=1 Tax=Streptomyces sodiiphilus TaxID=226217 RepID=A0ABN2P163_9ACTN
MLDRAVAQWRQEGPRYAAAVADDNLAAYALVKAARSQEAEPFLRGTQGLVTA